MDQAAPQLDRAALERRNNLSLSGRGSRPLVFSHGFGIDQTIWRLLTPAFEASHRIMTLDLVGSGQSDREAYRKAKYQTLDGYVDDLLEICAAFALQDITYVGHSVSAMIGLLAVLREPARFRSLVMLGASPRYLNDVGYEGGFTPEGVEDLLRAFDANREAWANHLSSITTLNAHRPELAQEVSRRFQVADASIARHFAQVTFAIDLRARLAECPVPTLLLQSRKDIIVPVGVSEYLARSIPGARLVFLRSEGHFAQLSDPAEVAEAIAGFLERLP